MLTGKTPEPILGRHEIGRTGVVVTELGFGGTTIGNLYSPVTDKDAKAAIEAAWDGGIRYFDTAPHYGLGLSERRLGAALAAKPRNDYVLSTKVGRRLQPNPRRTGSDLSEGGYAVPDDLTRVWDFSRDGVWRSIEASLDRLGLDRIDIAFVHDPDGHDNLDQAIHETIPALTELRDQGVIRAVGAGMNFVAPLSRIAVQSDVDVIMGAGRWTLIDRSAAPLLDACGERGIAVLAAAPFNGDLLSRPAPQEGSFFDYAPATPQILATAQRMAALCLEHGIPLPHAALRFPYRHPAVTSVVCGMRTAEEVIADLRWAMTDLPEQTWRALDEPSAHILYGR